MPDTLEAEPKPWELYSQKKPWELDWAAQPPPGSVPTPAEQEQIRRLPRPEELATYGGPPKPVASLAETLVEPTEAALTPKITTPKLPIKEGESKLLTVGKEAVNILAGIPEFISSPAGVVSAVVAPAAPLTVGTVFTAAMLKDLAGQIQESYKDWDKMSDTQKTKAITDMVATGTFAGLPWLKPAVRALRSKTTPTPEVSDASKIGEAEKVYGDVRPQPEQGLREVPVQESGAGVQPQAPQSEIPLKPQGTTFSKGETVDYYSPVTHQKHSGIVSGDAYILGNQTWVPIVNEDGAPVTQLIENVTPKKPTVTETTPPVPPEEMPKTPSQTGLYPAVREVGGKVDVAEAGTTHPQIIKEEGLKAEDIDQRGFVDEQGKFKDREQAAAQSGVPTEREPGRQHSTDLPEAQETFAQREARLFHESQLRQSVPAAELPKPTTKLPDLVKTLGRNEVNALLGEWEDGAELSADGKYIKSWSDPRNPTSKSRVPATEFLSWYEQKAKAPTPVDVPPVAKAQAKVSKVAATEPMIGMGAAVPGEFRGEESPKRRVQTWTPEYPGGELSKSKVDAIPERIRNQLADKVFELERKRAQVSQGSSGRHWRAVDDIRTNLENKLAQLGVSRMERGSGEMEDAIRVLMKLGYERAAARGEWDIKNWRKPTTPEHEKQPTATSDIVPGVRPGEETSGPGTPSATQPPDPKAAIEALEESFRNIQGPKPTLPEQVRKAFSVGEKASRAKDAVSSALQGMKSAGDYLINKWKGEPKLDDMLRAKGELSAELEKRGWRVRQFVKTVQKAMPTQRQRAAVLKWVDAGGDPAELQRGLAETKPEFKQAYADALALKGDDLIAAQNIRSYFDERLDDAVNAGVLETGVENYIRRLYERDPKAQKQALAYVQSGLLHQNPGLVKKRVFQFDWEAERAGYRPVQDFLPRIATYESELSKAIAARKFVRQMVGYEEGNKRFPGMKAPDGRPVVDVAGLGVPVEDAAGVREATLIKPSFKPGDEADPKNNRRDYVERDYPALRKWRWTTLDAGGKPIFVQGNLLIHPDFAGRVDALLEPSRVRYGRYAKTGRAALGVSSTVKQTMLDLSGFHQVQITVHGMEHKVMPWKIVQDIDFANPNMDGLLKGGLTLGGEYYSAHHGEGLVGSALTRHIPFLGPLMESYHNWLFQSYIPRIKTTMALNALERNRARYKGKLSEEQIYAKTASEANSAFGELNYIMLERSKTTQDIARLVMLAPDFLEARGRFAGGALEKGGKGFGHEQRAALLLGALTMYVTARIANKLTDDKYHFEPENAFSLVHNGHAYSLRTVQGDILHLLEQPVQFWMNRLNPVFGRTALELATGRDYFGRKRSVPEALWDTVKNTVPIALRSSQERKLWESMMNSMGVTARRWNDVDKAFTLAKDWKKQHGVVERGEFIYDPDKDPLRGLKIALSHNDDVGAAKEIKKLLTSKVYTREKLNAYFDRYAKMPFTGSVSNDKKWESGLTQDQKAIVEGARQHKLALRNMYRQARAKYDDLAKTPLPP